jgi:hypothetical protein
LIHAKDPNEGGAFVLKIGRRYHYINSNDIACGHANLDIQMQTRLAGIPLSDTENAPSRSVSISKACACGQVHICMI